MTKKELKDINVRELNCYLNKNIEIFPLIGKKNEKYFATFVKIENTISISIYEIKQNTIININKIAKDFNIDNEKCAYMPYNEKIVVLFKNFKLFFIDINNNESYNSTLENLVNNNFNLNQNNINNNDDDNFNNYNSCDELFDIYYNKINNDNISNIFHNSSENNSPNISKYNINCFKTNNKIIKINEGNFLLLYMKNVYLITLDVFLKSIRNITKLKDLDDVIKINSIYYKNNNIIEKGIIILSQELKKNFYDKFNKLLLKLNRYNTNMVLIDIFEVYIPIKNEKEEAILEISYNFLNDMILILSETKIYQINSIYKDLVTIYDLSLYINETNIKASIFFNYDYRNKIIEQIIILIDKTNDKIYQFNWNNKMLIFSKQYEYKNIIDFIPLYEADIFNELNNKKDIHLEKMIVCNDKIIIFN